MFARNLKLNNIRGRQRISALSVYMIRIYREESAALASVCTIVVTFIVIPSAPAFYVHTPLYAVYIIRASRHLLRLKGQVESLYIYTYIYRKKRVKSSTKMPLLRACISVVCVYVYIGSDRG